MKTGNKKRAASFLCACLMAASAVCGSFGVSAASTSTMSTASKNVTPSKISVKVQDADVRDVFSAIAVNMGYNIVYVAQPQTVTIEMKDVQADTAFEYLLRTLNLQYIPDGKTLIVGDPDQLTSNFRTHLSLCSFNLTYIDCDVLASKIQELGLAVTVITVPGNSKMIWVQGFAVDISKINDLIYMLDIPANAASATATGGGKALTYVTVGNGMTAYEFNRLLQTLGIDCGLCLNDDGSRLYLYATSDELSTINDLLTKVNTDGSYAALSNANKSEILTAANISKSAAIAAIQKACPQLQILTVDNSSKAFLVMGSNDVIQKAKEMLAQVDVATMNSVKNTVNVYQLKNITGAEAVRRLNSVSFDDAVQFYASEYAEFSKSLYVYCNEFYWTQVQALIAKIDVGDVNMSGVPVYKGAAAAVGAMQNALVQMTGIPAAQFATYTMGTDTYLYLNGADASQVAAVDAMINRLGSVPTDSTSVDVSVATYQAYCTANNITFTYEGYGAWVAARLGTTGSQGGALQSYSLEAYSAPEPVATPTATPTATLTPSEKLEQAQTALQALFGTQGSYAPTSTTTPDQMLADAQAAVAAANLTDVAVSINPDRTVSYTPASEGTAGLISLPLYLTCEGSYQCYQANTILPAVTPAA